MRPDVEMSLGEHLDELRKRIMRALLGVLVAACIAGVFYQEIMTALLAPYLLAWEKLGVSTAPENPTPPPGTEGAAGNPLAAVAKNLPPRIILGSPATGILAIIIVTSVVGVILASPWVIYQIWAFVGVGLHEKERKFLRVYVPISCLLFIVGGALFYFAILPYGLAALMSPALTIQVKGIPLIDPSVMLEDYLKFIALMTLIFGLTFQTPLVIIFLARTGIVPLETLARRQKIIIFIMIVVGAVLAPTGDPMTCTLMAVPLIVLYEVGLLVSWLMGRKERKLRLAEEAAQAAEDAKWEREHPSSDANSTEPSDPYGTGEDPGGGESPTGTESAAGGGESPGSGAENPGGGGEEPPDDVEPMH